MVHPLRGKTACVGVATAGTGEAPGRNAMEIMVEAVHGALADAQIPLSEVDGLFAATAFHSMANMSLAEHLGIQPAYSNGSNIGGSSFMMHALDAAMALEAGLINVAVIAYGSNQRTAGSSTARATRSRPTRSQPRATCTSTAVPANSLPTSRLRRASGRS
jgi:acetyl-CoA acetyltransferase